MRHRRRRFQRARQQQRAELEREGFSIKRIAAIGMTRLVRVRDPLDDHLRRGGNMRDFGAVGDGITDDSVAIQAADNTAAKGWSQPTWFIDPSTRRN